MARKSKMTSVTSLGMKNDGPSVDEAPVTVTEEAPVAVPAPVEVEVKVEAPVAPKAPVVAAKAVPAPVPVAKVASVPAPVVKTASVPLFSVETASTTASWWQYSRWVTLIARNARISEPTGVELTAVKTFLKAIWNPQTQTGTRSWLEMPFNRKSVTASASRYQGDIDSEPTHVLVEMLVIVGRNMNKIPITAAEKTLVDTLITATGNRRYGTGALFGGTAGSLVTVP